MFLIYSLFEGKIFFLHHHVMQKYFLHHMVIQKLQKIINFLHHDMIRKFQMLPCLIQAQHLQPMLLRWMTGSVVFTARNAFPDHHYRSYHILSLWELIR